MADRFYVGIGAAIRKRRDELGMTQATLASFLGLSRTSVTNIEGGRQPMLVHHLLHVGVVLGLDVSELLRSVNVEEFHDGEVSDEFRELLSRLEPLKEYKA